MKIFLSIVLGGLVLAAATISYANCNTVYIYSPPGNQFSISSVTPEIGKVVGFKTGDNGVQVDGGGSQGPKVILAIDNKYGSSPVTSSIYVQQNFCFLKAGTIHFKSLTGPALTAQLHKGSFSGEKPGYVDLCYNGVCSTDHP